jgi:hypothetical protein
MNSEEKLEITIEVMEEYGGKEWVKVRLINGCRAFVPSFHDLYRIVAAICWCEDAKYPPSQGYSGGKMVGRFLWDCVNGVPFDELAKKYKIPEREE